ncbi:hypothetical protein [Actinomadura madurae]|uniref:hypothetical protein n=1 Tax=Actinomadura madurae TaxID=1993 RepID=UPI0020D2375F|nr:hypothetical protein [Actinomadura madurae]MCQ0018195.1 hypothetical protein [Actinomadura madurae]
MVLRRMRAGDEEEFVRLARQSTELHADWVRTPADPAAFRDYLGRFADPTAGEALLVKQADTGAIAATSPSPESSAGPYDRAILGFAAFAPSAARAI